MATLADALSMPLTAQTASSSSSSRFTDPASSSSDAQAAGGGSASNSTSHSTSKNSPIFEFTKRKRWADLLVTELSEAIIFVLSPTGKVWYCGAAVAELLGWKDEDVVDREFTEYINHDDVGPFQMTFQRCIQHRSELLTYLRLRCKPVSASRSQDFQASAKSPVKEVLFEVKGYPHFVSDGSAVPECKCFFVMAKPYPSRNIAMLNTFLELKMENQRLDERVAQLRALADGDSSASSPATAAPSQSYYATSSSQSQSQQYVSQLNPPPFLPEPTSFYSGSYEELLPSPSGPHFESMFGSQRQQPPSQPQQPLVASASISGPTEDEEASAKKKLKKTYGLEQYVCVTCGRTDSPEWRKGPNGPKTLCNACGLRWAKTVKSKKDTSSSTNRGDA